MVDEKDYEVGYGKPPKANQFKPGQSGNPKGRKKGSLNVATMMQKLMTELVTVVEKGQERTMPMIEVVLRRVVNKAATGDLKAIPLVLAMVEQGLDDTEEEAISPEKDRLLLHSALLKMGRGLLTGEAGAGVLP
jgi:hypothetical protein